MQRRIFHGILSPTDIAQALLAEFNQGNIRVQVFGKSDKLAIQIGTRPGTMSGRAPAHRLRVSTPARAATYAYVNPVVAVFLGWALGGEPLTLRTLLAAAVIVSAVVIITYQAHKEDTRLQGST